MTTALVIGAGPSGLAALKELCEAGIDARCIDAAPDLGGVFRYDPNGGGVWPGCRLTSSATTTAYSDFPPQDASPHQMLHTEYWEYLNQYVDHFRLRGRLRFGERVTAVETTPSGGWRVVTRNEGGEETVYGADHIAYCAGLHQNRFVPNEVRGFRGDLHHSADFRSADRYAGRRVLVIGAGESGADIVKAIADVADRCVLSLRRGVAVLPRQRGGYPTDYYTTRLFYSLPRWMARAVNPRRAVKARRALMMLLTAPVFVPLVATAAVVETTDRIVRRRTAVPLPVVRKIGELMRASGGSVGDQFLTKSEAFVHAIVDGSCVVEPAVTAVADRTVVFANGHREEFDDVVCCTGFDARIDLLPDVQPGRLYEGVFSPALGARVGFIGMVRPAIGAIPPIAEMQARLFAQVCAGRHILPERQVMEAAVAADVAHRESAFALNAARMPYLVDYTSYMDRLAEIIGCKPRRSDLWRDPKLLYKFYYAHFMPAQYRLVGVGAKAESAALQIKSQVVAYSKIYLPFMLFYLYFSKFMHAIGVKSYKTHLEI